MADLDRLRQLTLDAIQPYVSALTSGGSASAFRRGMEQAIIRAHTAAYLSALAEKSAGGKIRQFLSNIVGVRALSKQDQAALKKAIDTQLKYLDGFIADLKAGKLTPAQASARAGLYAGPSRATYSAARYPGLPFYPCQGTECKANCRCSWKAQGDDYYWTLGATEHCPTCVSRAAGNPYQVSI